MIVVEEDYLRFEFDEVWDHVSHWDEDDAFKKGIHGVEGVRGLDIIALSPKRRECLLMEIKDFRDQNELEAETLERAKKKRKGGNKGKRRRQLARSGSGLHDSQASSALIDQVAQKVAGTLAGLVGASRMQDTDFAADFVDALATYHQKGYEVRVVLWVEGQPTSKGKSLQNKAHLSALTAKLKKKVKWLTDKPVQVLSTASPPVIPGLNVVDSRP